MASKSKKTPPTTEQAIIGHVESVGVRVGVAAADASSEATSSASVQLHQVTCGLARLVAGLSWETRPKERMPLPEALRALEALAGTVGVDCADF